MRGAVFDGLRERLFAGDLTEAPIALDGAKLLVKYHKELQTELLGLIGAIPIEQLGVWAYVGWTEFQSESSWRSQAEESSGGVVSAGQQQAAPDCSKSKQSRQRSRTKKTDGNIQQDPAALVQGRLWFQPFWTAPPRQHWCRLNYQRSAPGPLAAVTS
jgi:hypothetical protein